MLYSYLAIPPPPSVKVHSGFLSMYKSVREKLILKIKDFAQNLNSKKIKFEIVVTGHSLGAALAVMLMHDLR